MTETMTAAPRLSAAQAAELAEEYFAIRGTAEPLPSERDQNFLITADGGERMVLKIANGAEDRAMLEAQQKALAHVAKRLAVTPRVLAMRDGSTLAGIDAPDGSRHMIWGITHLAGIRMAEARRRSSDLLLDLGRKTAALTTALGGFDHPAIHRDFYWDLARARAMVDGHLPALADADLRRTIDRLASRFDRYAAPLLARLPLTAIHGDLNDHNVLVAAGGAVDQNAQAVSGIVDFGDMTWTYRVGDLAIAIAYVILGSSDPLGDAAQVVRGYSDERVLGDAELGAVFGLVSLRLCASACIAAEQLRQRPDNEYLGISQSAIAALLPALASTPFALGEAVFRQAANVDPVPRARRVVEHLRAQPAFAPVLGVDLRTAPPLVLDLSVASPLISGDLTLNDEPHLTERVFSAMRNANANVAVGRYDEPRLLYVAPAFAGGPGANDEHRTIHIGLDLFAEAGTAVRAPLDGVVHACANNDAPQDYGAVIILRHETNDGAEFFTLYGHLSRASLDRVAVGQSVRAGEEFATLGVPAENGGWTPHLHLQIIVDLLELGTDFPGVARPSQRTVWTALCPDPNLLVGAPGIAAASTPRSRTLAMRREHIGGNLSIAYREPVKIVRGWMQYLYDDEGRLYVDAYNNVPHVGHCHPRVVDAAAAQMRVLNTNTRYLNDLLAEYAARLSATLPRPLDVCYFVSSASEANELALRLARAYTGRRETIVLEAAYHGNTTSLIDISPYKHAGPGGGGAPHWVRIAPLPDDYRGPHKRGDPEAGAKYAEQVGELARAMEREGGPPGAFIAETCPSVGGQIVLPNGYLSNVYEYIRMTGGVCVADEVQTGLGRMGTSFWAFEDQGVVPDIVVMGKPLGNGHPIGAVATTHEIADAFDNGMEYFSTFGGNTVSCAIGLAVLDVIRDEELQKHAREVGEYLLARLRPLAERYTVVGDVRGSGLFLGVELVRDRETLEPAGAEASYVANRMRERGVLLGTDGPHHNVVKIRPPMPFTMRDADVLVRELERALGELPECSAPGRDSDRA